MNGQVVIFHKGHRTTKVIHPTHLREAATKVKELKAKGVKAHLVYRTDRSKYPAPDEIEEHREAGELWCPYCRAWRWFTVPKFKPDADFGTEDWFMNSFHRQEIRVCQWCHMSVSDFYVRRANGFSIGETTRRRRKKRRAR